MKVSLFGYQPLTIILKRCVRKIKIKNSWLPRSPKKILQEWKNYDDRDEDRTMMITMTPAMIMMMMMMMMTKIIFQFSINSKLTTK